jgi:hypothetical protein
MLFVAIRIVVENPNSDGADQNRRQEAFSCKRFRTRNVTVPLRPLCKGKERGAGDTDEGGELISADRIPRDPDGENAEVDERGDLLHRLHARSFKSVSCGPRKGARAASRPAGPDACFYIG